MPKLLSVAALHSEGQREKQPLGSFSQSLSFRYHPDFSSHRSPCLLSVKWPQLYTFGICCSPFLLSLWKNQGVVVVLSLSEAILLFLTHYHLLLLQLFLGLPLAWFSLIRFSAFPSTALNYRFIRLYSILGKILQGSWCKNYDPADQHLPRRKLSQWSTQILIVIKWQNKNLNLDFLLQALSTQPLQHPEIQ